MSDSTTAFDPSERTVALEYALQALLQGGRHRDVVQFVESWSRAGIPSEAAYRMLAESYIGLGQAKLAWSAIETAIADQPSVSSTFVEPVSRLVTSRGIRVPPGWLSDLANGTISKAEFKLRMEYLLSTKAQGWRPTEAPPAESDAVLDQAVLAMLNDQWGVAKRLIQHASETDPLNLRALDIRWAMDGCPSDTVVSIEQLHDRYASLLIPDETTDDITDVVTADSPETTPSKNDTGKTVFPALFRDDESPFDSQSSDPEPTISTDNPDDPPEFDSTNAQIGFSDTDNSEGTDEHTGVAHIIQKDGLPLPETYAHTPTAFEIPEEVGLPTASGRAISESDLEDEDEDVVVLRSSGPDESWDNEATSDVDPTETQLGRAIAHLLGSDSRPVKAKPKPVLDSPSPSEQQPSQKPTIQPAFSFTWIAIGLILALPIFLLAVAGLWAFMRM